MIIRVWHGFKSDFKIENRKQIAMEVFVFFFLLNVKRFDYILEAQLLTDLKSSDHDWKGVTSIC